MRIAWEVVMTFQGILISCTWLALLTSACSDSPGEGSSSANDGDTVACTTAECLPALLTDLSANKSYRDVMMDVSVRYRDDGCHVEAVLSGRAWTQTLEGGEVGQEALMVHVLFTADRWTSDNTIVVRSDETEAGDLLSNDENGTPTEDPAVQVLYWPVLPTAATGFSETGIVVNPPGQLTLALDDGMATGTYRGQDDEALYELSAPLELTCFTEQSSAPTDLSRPPCSDWADVVGE